MPNRMHVQLSEEAEYDLEIAYDWYEEKLIGLGDDFLQEFRLAMATAVSQPLGFQLVYQKYHQLPMRRFPYIILYIHEETDRTLYIYRVFHSVQNPSKWKK